MGLLNPNTYVVGVDSASNIFARDVLGNKNDTNSGDSARAVLELMDDHFHKGQQCYPDLDDAITVASSASAWTYGAYVEIIPVNTITSDFDIHWLNISAISANDEYEVQFATGLAGAEVNIACASFERTAVQSQEGSISMQGPIIPANTRVSARLASKAAAANSANFKVHYHTY